MMNIKFRKLNPEEIIVRVGKVNRGGAVLLLYKDNGCDRTILDEAVGPMNWQRSHSRDNCCVVSIWDEEKGSWVSKEDIGGEKDMSEKSVASDAFKRACLNWGIGKELLSASQLDLFFPKQNLIKYEYDEEKQEGRCLDNFKVLAIEYDEDIIKSITIESTYYSKTRVVKTFTREGVSTTASPESKSTSVTEPAPGKEVNLPDDCLLDDEIILIGNCRKKRYGDVKGTAEWVNFIEWIKGSNTTYPDARQQQYERIKRMVQKSK